jgi:hypothetical protein
MNIFSVQADSSDVEVIMHEVGKAVQRWEGSDALPLDLAFVQRREERLLQEARQLHFQAALDGNAIVHSTRPRFGPWIIRFQQFVRRVTWWFLEPILQQIRTFQLHTAQVVEILAENQETLLLELQRLAPPNAVEETSSPSIAPDTEG